MRLVLMKRMPLRRAPLPTHLCRLPLLQVQEAVDVDVALGETMRTMLAEALFAVLVVEAVLPVSVEHLETPRSPVTSTETMVRLNVLILDCWHVLLTVPR